MSCQQVNTFYRSCRGRASCNCAVAVRVDDDVVVINKCPAEQDVEQEGLPISVTLYRNGDLAPGFRVNKYDEDKYAVSRWSIFYKACEKNLCDFKKNLWLNRINQSLCYSVGKHLNQLLLWDTGKQTFAHGKCCRGEHCLLIITQLTDLVFSGTAIGLSTIEHRCSVNSLTHITIIGTK